MRDKALPLTETVYYILLATLHPTHGYAIMQKIEALSHGEVRMAAGTLYGAIDSLQKQNLIVPVASEDPRRKVYQITTAGIALLKQDTARMQHMVTTTTQHLKELGL
ncbi:PadR family transcriptional regulator [Ruminococcaceae bacterium OttesenSCG-928-A16]|nr:PadR family transcriptional regulator [Ruminococcaceae bacterium OttesenSCG-928-A16]